MKRFLPRTRSVCVSRFFLSRAIESIKFHDDEILENKNTLRFVYVYGRSAKRCEKRARAIKCRFPFRICLFILHPFYFLVGRFVADRRRPRWSATEKPKNGLDCCDNLATVHANSMFGAHQMPEGNLSAFFLSLSGNNLMLVRM